MLSSEVGAYQSAAYAVQQATSGTEQARVSGSHEVSAFPHTSYGVSTRAAVSSADNTGRTPPKSSDQKSANTEGRGSKVDIVA